ncbi:hypothetical protein [Puia dinghuensis]|uniref:Uncharacterized protein n=1 Tax=Puia dinghuensis TaxID=1792502 RepID=A0A8J2UGU0_9BACT|nr:hypothetical protein [Puia dinghuensis]GGB13871.1 hypothetical protein GCM10011511_42010 [Puia dinghuensis]
MKKLLVSAALAVLAFTAVPAQKKVLGYPFQFEKSFLAKGNYSTYFLNNPDDSAFALILKDNKKVEYVWLSKSFKVLGKVPSPIEKTILDQGTHHYIGGTVKGSEYHFIYQVKSGYSIETVDFNSGSVSNKKLLDLPDGEKLLIAFCDHNTYYAVAADDKAGAVVLHIVNTAGVLSQQSFPFTIPENAHKHKVSEYLAGMKVIKSEEDPELSVAIHSVKIFSRPGDLSIVVNNGDNPTRIFSIDPASFAVKDRTIDYSSLVSSDDRGKLYISSFLKDDHLFSLMLNKKNIRITIHDVNNGKLLNKYEFTDDAGLDLLPELPITEKRMGKQVQAKDVDDLKKVIRAFTKGSEGIMVAQAEPGSKLVVTAGTYDPIAVPSGGATAGHFYTPGYSSPNPDHNNALEWQSYYVTFYVPGTPSYTKIPARYYTTTYFRMLLDPTTLKVTRGQVRRPVADQIKDYMEDTDKRGKATNQFAIGKNQYYGFYDRDEQQYVIEQIRIF